MTTEQKPPTYRDAQLGKLMKALRATVRTNPGAKLALERVETRLRATLRTVELWDTSHADRAEALIRLGNIQAANTAASLIFDVETRQLLLRRCFIGLDDRDRIAEAQALGREVLN